jgi:hypothetical protein
MAERLAASTPERDHRAALARLPVTRKSELLERQKAGRARVGLGPVRRLLGHRLAGLRGCTARAASTSRPARSTNPKAVRPTTGAARAMFAAGFAPATWCTTASATT